MQTDQKRHLEAGGTSGILRRILIREVNNKVWTRGQSKAALILGKSNVEQVRSFGKWVFIPQKMCLIRPGVTGRINTCIVASSHIINHTPTLHNRLLTTFHNKKTQVNVPNSRISPPAQVESKTLHPKSHVMPNSCNTICTRQQGDELLPCCYGNTSYAENTMPWYEKW